MQLSSKNRSGKARVVPAVAAANSFTNVNFDELINEIDEAENRAGPKDIIKKNESEKFSVDSLLNKIDEADRGVPKALGTGSPSPPKKADSWAAADKEAPAKYEESQSKHEESQAKLEEIPSLRAGLPSTRQEMETSLSPSSSHRRIISTSSKSNVMKMSVGKIEREDIEERSPPKDKDSKPEQCIGALEEERKLREQLDSKFRVLMSQMLEFHVRLREASSRLSGYESLRVDMEDTIADLERETMLLQNKLDHRDSSMVKMNTKSEKIARGNDARRQALLAEANKEDFAFKFENLAIQRKGSGGLVSQLEQRVLEYVPFASDVRKVQSRFGSSVAAYFDFYRFMFVQFSLVSCVCIVLAAYHISQLEDGGAGGGIFWSKGVAPGFIKFSSFSSNENLLFSSVVVAGSAVFIVTLFFQVVHKDRLAKELDAVEAESDTRFAKVLLCAWDFALITKRQKDEYSGMVAQEMLQRLSDEKVGVAEKKRSNYEFAVLVAKRVLGSAVYFVLQICAMALIIYVTISAAQINDNVSGVKLFRSMAPFFSAICLSVLNSGLPYVMQLITDFEAWDSPTLELNILLSRMYFSNMFNVLILAGSYALLADPMLLAYPTFDYYRRLLEIQFHSNQSVCRMDQVAEGLFSLLLTAFAMKMLVVVLNPVSDYVYAIVTGTEYSKTEFNIASSIVSMLYLATLAMLLFPYAPIGVVVMPVMLFVLLKWEKYVMLRLYRSPKRPWKAQKAGEVFSIFYLTSFFLVGLPASTFFFSVTSFAKECDLQDSFINLCANTTLSTNSTCSPLNPNSAYFGLYSDPAYCKGGYPACVCQYACGPFTRDSNNLAPFRSSIESIYILDYIWQGLFTYPYGPWVLVSMICLVAFFLRNSLRVQTKIFALKEKAMQTRIDALESSNKDKEKRIQKIQAFEAHANIKDSFIVPK